MGWLFFVKDQRVNILNSNNRRNIPKKKKKVLITQITMTGDHTLEPDILECEVNWALGSITANKWSWWNPGWAISNLKRRCCKSALLNMPANLKNSAVATGLEKVSFHSNAQKGNAKQYSNYHTVVVISHASKVMPKMFPVRPQQYVTWELLALQIIFRKGRRTRDQIADIH